MKRICWIISILIISIAIPATALAQELGKEVSVFDLDMPNNPAFILLDNAPSVIQRPNSSKAIGTTLLQDIASDGVLDNIALEVTPFWLSKNPNRSALKYYGVDASKNQKYFSKLKLASFSGAYVKEPSDIINVSFGGRATLFEIKRKTDIDDYFEAYHGIYEIISNIGDLLEEEFDKENPIPTCENGETEEECKKLREAYNLKLKEFTNSIEDPKFKQKKIDEKSKATGWEEKMQEIIKRKPLLAIDIAAAYNQRFYNDEFNNNGFGRFGVWGTLALYPNIEDHKFLNLYVFTRYLVEGDASRQIITTNDDRFNAFDLGIKGELEFDRITLGYEYINRSGDLEGYRSAGTIKYEMSENIFLTGAFGNNFEENDDLITLFGIQWGLNNPIQSVGISE